MEGLSGSGEGDWISDRFKSKTPCESKADSLWVKAITMAFVLRYVRWIWCLNPACLEQWLGSQSHCDTSQYLAFLLMESTGFNGHRAWAAFAHTPGIQMRQGGCLCCHWLNYHSPKINRGISALKPVNLAFFIGRKHTKIKKGAVQLQKTLILMIGWEGHA